MTHTTPVVTGELPPHLVIVSDESLSETELKAHLTDQELALYETKPADKQRQWLCGRLAAKRAVQAFLQTKGITVELHTIAITPNAAGVPTCQLLIKSEAFSPPPLVSISHSDTIAIAEAVAADTHRGLGVDVERIRSFSETTCRAFMAPEEYAVYQALPDTEKSACATRLWCLKEAYLKALGTGLRTHPRTIIFDISKEIWYKGDSPGLSPTPTFAYWTSYREVYIITSISL